MWVFIYKVLYTKLHLLKQENIGYYKQTARTQVDFVHRWSLYTDGLYTQVVVVQSVVIVHRWSLRVQRGSLCIDGLYMYTGGLYTQMVL